MHCESITLISSIFNFNHNILCTWPHAQLRACTINLYHCAIHNWPIANLHSLVFQMYFAGVFFALHGYTRFWLQFLNNSSPVQSYTIAIINTCDIWHWSILLQLYWEADAVWEQLRGCNFIISIAVMYNCMHDVLPCNSNDACTVVISLILPSYPKSNTS